MSLIAIIFIAIVIPFVIMFLGFTWFFIQSRIAKLAAARKPRSRRSESSYRTRLEFTSKAKNSTKTAPAGERRTSKSKKPTYKPLSHFLDSSEEIAIYNNLGYDERGNGSELTAIPGISKEIEQELYSLGYSSLEQIARWGRADVRAVSAGLGIDQHLIEEEWIANARLILAIRSTSLTS